MSIEDWNEFTFSNDKRFLIKESPFSQKLTEIELKDGINNCLAGLGGIRAKHIEDNLPDPLTDQGRKLLSQALINMAHNYELKYEAEKKRLLEEFDDKHKSIREFFIDEIKMDEYEEFLRKRASVPKLQSSQITVPDAKWLKNKEEALKKIGFVRIKENPEDKKMEPISEESPEN